MTKEKKLVTFWKDFKVTTIKIGFSMGGDSGELNEIECYSNDVEVKLTSFQNDLIEEWCYEAVRFYPDSDGHYQGESGHVILTESNNNIDWVKDSEDNYTERKFETFTKKCNPYYSENILVIEKSEWDNRPEVEYAPDFKAIDIEELENFVEELEKEAKVKYESDDERYEQLNITFTDDTAHIEVVLSYDSYVPGDGDSGSIKLN